jgi:16S rRNA (guanine527-N7)-methyltransferase
VGFLGPGPLRVHLDHAAAYARHLPESGGRLIDLGSGAGLPGLPLLVHRPDLEGVLLDAAQKRVSFLVWALTELGLDDRVTAVTARAEEAAHEETHRQRYDVVVCRGFGPPATTIECSVGYLAEGGRLLVSEPPHGRAWPEDALASIGLRLDPRSDDIAVFERVGPLPERIPRRAKLISRQPLF